MNGRGIDIKYHLAHGERNAITARQLARTLHCNERAITEMITQERRNGVPICAVTSGSNPGYFIADGPEELDRYCRKLLKRGGELFKTRRALLAVLEEMTAKEDPAGTDPERNQTERTAEHG